MKLKIKSNLKSGLLCIGKIQVKDELVVEASELEPFKKVCENYKNLGWCSISEVKSGKKSSPKKVSDAKPVEKPKKVSDSKPVEKQKEAPKRRRRRNEK